MTPTVTSFADLLQSAVTEPGTISAAYQQFHNYSIGNQLLAWSQCRSRNIAAGPMATFPKWKALGRHVRKGEKALVLCQPVTIKRTREQETNSEGTDVYTRFVYRPAWFVLAQTEAWIHRLSRFRRGTGVTHSRCLTLQKSHSMQRTVTSRGLPVADQSLSHC